MVIPLAAYNAWVVLLLLSGLCRIIGIRRRVIFQRKTVTAGREGESGDEFWLGFEFKVSVI